MIDLLPIGSIIRVEGIDVMICAYMKKDSILNKKTSNLNKKYILERVKFIGFQDNQFVEFKNKLEKEND